MALYTFDCRVCGREFDALRKEAECCGQPADRQAVYAFSVGKREQKVNVTRAIEAQHELIDHSRRTGEPLPDFLGMAKRKAKALRQAGEPLRSRVVTEVN